MDRHRTVLRCDATSYEATRYRYSRILERLTVHRSNFYSFDNGGTITPKHFAPLAKMPRRPKITGKQN